jgi:signal transduction histidine kinase
MIGLRRALGVIGVLALVIGLAEIPIILGSDHFDLRGLQLAFTLAAGWGFIGTGLFLWARRPDNRIGPLMVLVGFLWFLSQLTSSDNALLFTIGGVFGSVYVAATMQLVLAYPSGELAGRGDRVVIGLAYFVTTIALVPMYLFLDPVDDGCEGCPDNLIMIARNEDVVVVMDALFSVLGVVVLGYVVVTLIRRWRAAGPGRGELLGPVYGLLGVLLTMLGLTLAVDLFGTPDFVESGLYLAGIACFALMPYAFLGSLARSRLIDVTVLEAENERLYAALRARVEELRASRQRIVEAGVAERRRLERNLHDGAQQRLVSLALAIRMARTKLPDDPDAASELLDGASEELELALAELRELARGIHPAVLSDRGLGAALEALASRAPVPVELSHGAVGEISDAAESAAYFVVAEALTNVAKYAQASSATVSVARVDGAVEIAVADDGVGGADPDRGSGLRGLADRLAALNGELEVESAVGAGTKVQARIPCAEWSPTTPSCCARGWRGCSRRTASRWSVRRATRTTYGGRSTRTSQTWRSSTSGCPRTTPTMACGRRSTSVAISPRRPCWSSRSTSRRATRSTSSATAMVMWATC